MNCRTYHTPYSIEKCSRNHLRILSGSKSIEVTCFLPVFCFKSNFTTNLWSFKKFFCRKIIAKEYWTTSKHQISYMYYIKEVSIFLGIDSKYMARMMQYKERIKDFNFIVVIKSASEVRVLLATSSDYIWPHITLWLFQYFMISVNGLIFKPWLKGYVVSKSNEESESVLGLSQFGHFPTFWDVKSFRIRNHFFS